MKNNRKGKGEKKMAKWAELGRDLRDQFRLKAYPIGFKHFDTPEELDQIPDLKRMDHYFVFCQMLAQARNWGITVGAKNRDKMFAHCQMIHGLRPVRPEMFEIPPAGTEMPEGMARYVSSWEDNVKRNTAFPRIPVGGAVALAPLATITFDPDVIIVYGDPSQIVLMIQSMQKIEFERFEFACIGESSCADSLVECYLTGKPKVGLPGYGERALGHVRDEDLVLALPPSYLERVLDGFRELHKAGVSYPVALAGIDIDIAAPTSNIYDKAVNIS